MELKAEVCSIPLSADRIGLVSLYSGKKVILNNSLYASLLENSFDDNITDEKINNIKKCFFCINKDENTIESKKKSEDKYKALINNTDSLNLYLIPNRKCNFACKYCFMDDNISSSEMTDETLVCIAKWINLQYKVNNYKEINIDLYGGEPFYNSALTIKIMKYINTIAGKYNTKVRYAAATNGFNISESNIDNLIKCGLESVTITLDGPEVIHNNRRPLKKSSLGTYKIVLEHIKQIMKKINVCLNVVLDKYNFPYIDDLFYELKTEGVLDNVYVSITPMSNYCNQDFANRNKINDNEYHMLVDALNSASKYGITLAKPFSFLSPCFKYNKNSYAIDYNGDIYGCPGEYGIDEALLGNVKDPVNFKIKEIDFTKWDECWGCKYIFICGGEKNKYCTENTFGKKIDSCKKELYDDFIPDYLRKVFFKEYMYDRK